MNPLVSVIVPIYNVEKYLENCLNSIARQSYTNLQVILVNDGSPDNSKAICESFCHNDDRFQLINKSNGGLASARNAGLDVVNGDFIVCVDSDDWIEPIFVESMLKNMIDYGADLSVCSFYEDRANCVKKEIFTNKINVVSREDAIKKMITPGKFYGFSWNKMYRKSILAEQRYDETILKGEDSPFSLDYIIKCKKIVVQDSPLYHYRVDSISISRSSFNAGKMTVLKSYQYMIDTLKRKSFSNEILDMQIVQYAGKLLSLRTNVVLSGKENFLSQLQDIDNQMPNYEKRYVFSKYVDLKHKMAYVLAIRFKSLFDILCRFFKG